MSDKIFTDITTIGHFTCRTTTDANGVVEVSQQTVDSLSADIKALQELLKRHKSDVDASYRIKVRIRDFRLAREQVRLLLLEAGLIQGRIFAEERVIANLAATKYNELQILFGGPFKPVSAWKGPMANERPSEFPESFDALNAITSNKASKFLTFYGFPAEKTTSASRKKQRLTEIVTLHN